MRNNTGTKTWNQPVTRAAAHGAQLGRCLLHISLYSLYLFVKVRNPFKAYLQALSLGQTQRQSAGSGLKQDLPSCTSCCAFTEGISCISGACLCIP